MRRDYPKFEGFDWDEGNRQKNWLKHDVGVGECEQVFFNHPLLVLEDSQHSLAEKRFAAFGRTLAGRRLVIVCTMRGRLLRVISARDMNKKEREFFTRYEEEKA